MNTAPQSAVFQYWEDGAKSWAERLPDLKSKGIDEIHCFIPWGLHESVQGIRDFSKSSKLRLEKFLSMSHQAGLTVRATIGFPARRESIPDWAFAAGEHSALIPSGLWKKSADALSLNRLPSLQDDTFFTAYLEFISDVFALLSLYRFPEGPLVGVEVDWGVYEQDLGIPAVPSYASFLQKRYSQVGQINLRYQCTFRDFATATSYQGTRVLLDKRPWLAAFDYKFCRTKMLEDRNEGIAALNNAEPLLDLLCFPGMNEPAPTFTSAGEWAVAIDPTFLEGDPQVQAFPFAPLGLTNPQATSVYRLWEYMRSETRAHHVPLVSLDGSGEAPAQTITVISGRFLPSAAVRKLRRWADEGARVFFPFGLPQYDENLMAIDWKPSVPKAQIRAGQLKYAKLGLGKGLIWFLENPLTPELKFWEQIEGYSRQALGGQI